MSRLLRCDSLVFFFSSRRRHTRWNCDWSSDVCSSDLVAALGRELSATGLAAALDGGSARTILAWSERARAQAFRVLPVHADLPPASAADLAELRQQIGRASCRERV